MTSTLDDDDKAEEEDEALDVDENYDDFDDDSANCNQRN